MNDQPAHTNERTAMTTHQFDHPHHPNNGSRPSPRRKAVALAALIPAATLMLAACGGHTGASSPSQQAQAKAPLIAYAECMRTHGVNDFPDPSTSSTGGIGYSNAQIQQINQGSPAYQAAKTACQSLPGATTAQQLLNPHS
jgi:hypothetical protein